ncbi:MAG TPA: hypothetical protein VMH35_14615 [Streptosporangiaceae bacterium]|nr:hypothetical protein [Streptosporangiaceae bacterium]
MTTNLSVTSQSSVATAGPTTTGARPARRPPQTRLAPRRPWLVGGLLLAGAAQLIIISGLLSVDPLAVTWWSLLLAIAPAPLAAAAAFAPAPAARVAAAAAIVVVVVGLVGGILHTGLLFLPALVVLVIGSRELWRQRHMRPA